MGNLLDPEPRNARDEFPRRRYRAIRGEII